MYNVQRRNLSECARLFPRTACANTCLAISQYPSIQSFSRKAKLYLSSSFQLDNTGANVLWWSVFFTARRNAQQELHYMLPKCVIRPFVSPSHSGIVSPWQNSKQNMTSRSVKG